jgi:hypothetical protein
MAERRQDGYAGGAHRAFGTRADVAQDGAARGLEHRQVGGVVPRIDEPMGKPFLQPGEFRLRLEIVLAIAAGCGIERVQSARHGIGDRLVGGGHQMHRAAAPPLAADELEQRSPERNVVGVEAGEAGDLALERGATGCEPAQARYRAERLREQELHQAFVQRIRQQQRPVEIDDERNVGWCIQ